MSTIVAIITSISIILGLYKNNLYNITNSVMDNTDKSIQFILTIAGTMAFWGGLMNIVKESKLDEKISSLLKPLLRRIFSKINLSGAAYKAITLNVTANLLGLGNAATPLGIDAMKKIKQEENIENYPSQNMALFTLLNTASIQLIPSTIAAIRYSHGSKSPMDILPAVLISSFVTLICTVIFIKVTWKSEKRKTNV